MEKTFAESIQQLSIPKEIEGVLVGKVVNVDERGQVFVNFPGNSIGPVVARFTSSMKLKMLRHAALAGQEVLLAFENNDPKLPIIIDSLHSLVDEIIDSSIVALEVENPKDIVVDRKRVTFDAEEEVVLRCGEASIILRNDGKVVIKGKNILSRSRCMNKIKGGAVHIN